MWSEGGRKDGFRREFYRKTLVEYQIGDDIGFAGRLRVTPSPERWTWERVSIRVVEGIGVWLFPQKFCGVSARASILPESRQRRLQTSG